MKWRDVIEIDDRKVPWDLAALTGTYFDRADRRYVVRGCQRCNAVADLQQSLGRASAVINRVVPEQKQ